MILRGYDDVPCAVFVCALLKYERAPAVERVKKLIHEVTITILNTKSPQPAQNPNQPNFFGSGINESCLSSSQNKEKQTLNSIKKLEIYISRNKRNKFEVHSNNI